MRGVYVFFFRVERSDRLEIREIGIKSLEYIKFEIFLLEMNLEIILEEWIFGGCKVS